MKVLASTASVSPGEQESFGISSKEISERLEALEAKQAETENRLIKAEKRIDDLRDSAIRGDIAMGRKSKDTAKRFGLSAARISQIAPRRRYNNG